MLIKGCCGFMSINKKHQIDIESYQQLSCKFVECQTAIDFKEPPKPECKKNKCGSLSVISLWD